MNVHPALQAALWTALGVLAGLLVALTLPRLFGMPVLVLLSGSMEPEIATSVSSGYSP